MKLIIDISEEAKRHIDTFKGKFLCGDGCDMISAIQNGTPLDNVKAEIQTRHDSIRRNIQYDNGRIDALEWVLDILDNVGSEVKPNDIR